MRTSLISCCLVALVAGCAGRQKAPQTASLAPAGVAGYPAERYVLYAQPGQRFGTVEIRPVGVFQAPTREGYATVVHLQALLDDEGAAPLGLDLAATKLTVATTDNRTFDRLVPVRTRGTLTAPPHGSQQIDLFFALPPDVRPQAVAGMKLAWLAQAGANAYMTTTPIAQRYTPNDNEVSLYVVPGFDPLLRPAEKRVVTPRMQAHRTTVVF